MHTTEKIEQRYKYTDSKKSLQNDKANQVHKKDKKSHRNIRSHTQLQGARGVRVGPITWPPQLPNMSLNDFFFLF